MPWADMNLSPLPIQKFFDNNGCPLVGGLLFTYEAGTNNKIATYTDEAGMSVNSNPIVLDYRGECRVWLDPELTYKFVLSPSTDTDPPTNPIWTEDNIAGGVTISTLTQQFLGKIIYPLSTEESAAGVTPIAYIYEYGNVLRFGADPSGTTDSSLAVSSSVRSYKRVRFPDVNPGSGTIYKWNLLLQDIDDRHIFSDSHGVRHIPNVGGAGTWVLDIFGSSTGCTGIIVERMLFDSSSTGVPTGVGGGMRVRATTPGIVWQSTVRQIECRGFQDGFVIDCDVSIGEVFDNDFDQIQGTSCSRYSAKVRGIYNRHGRYFALLSGSYAFYSEASYSNIGQIACDGPIAFIASGQSVQLGKAIIEAINGAGSAVAFEVSTLDMDIGSIIFTSVPSAKCPTGVAVSNTYHTIRRISISGANFPTTPIQLNSSSAGILMSASIPGGTKITTSTVVTSNWRFVGDVSTAFVGDRYIDPNVFIENGGNFVLKAGGLADRSYSLQTPITGFSITIPNNCGGLILNPAGTLATGTITMPSTPTDGLIVRISSTQTITALTLNANAGQTIRVVPATLASGKGVAFQYTAGAATWYPLYQP